MLNYLWAFMIIIGVVYGAITGKMDQLGNGAIEAAGNAVTLCITMVGIVAMWSGLMEVAKKAGIISGATKLIRPFVHFLFPAIPKGHPALDYITTNFIANADVIIGLKIGKVRYFSQFRNINIKTYFCIIC